MEVRILGPVELSGSTGTSAPLSRQQRTVLGRLAAERGQVVATRTLIADLWADRAPARAIGLVHNLIRDVRQVLRTAGATDPQRVLATRAPGYLFTLDQDVDLERFRVLTDAARKRLNGGEHGVASAEFARALALWRGEPLGGVTDHLAEVYVSGLTELRLAACEDWAEAELALGRHVHLVPVLTDHVARHPFRERFRAQLMLALYRSGRQSDALAAYQDGRRLLVEATGLEPGPALQQVHRAILAEDPSLGGPTEPPTLNVAPNAPAPAHLPVAVSDFVGRDATVAQLVRALTAPVDGRVAPVVYVVAGTAGVGKTTLATHVAHLVRSHFPDGQLFVDLRGAEAQASPSAEVLGRFIRALTTDDTPVPLDPDERLTTYRGLVAHRAVLVVLDNAADEAQVRPLLPAGVRCAVLVTARSSMSALAGAHHVVLDVLAAEDAVALLARIAGRVDDPELAAVAGEVVALCGRLPLALRIAGARLAARPHWTGGRLVADLGDERRRLDRLALGDLDVRASVGLSYAGLADVARTAFALASLVDAPDFAPWTIAALTGRPYDETVAVLESLVDAQMLTVAVTDPAGQIRYRFHDLVRVFARERLAVLDPRDRREAARRWRSAAATLAERAVDRAGLRRVIHADTQPPLGEPPVEPTAQSIVDSSALSWLDAEHVNLAAAVADAHAHAEWWTLLRLVTVLCAYHRRRCRWDTWARIQDLALDAAWAVGSVEAEAYVRCGFGELAMAQGNWREAIGYLRQARSCFRAAGKARPAAGVLYLIATAQAEAGDLTTAVSLLRYARRIGRAGGDAGRRAHATHTLGTCYRLMGRLPEAEAALTESLAVFTARGDLSNESAVLRSLGDLYRDQARWEDAVAVLTRAADLTARAGHTQGEGWVLDSLVPPYRELGRLPEALTTARRAVTIFESIGDLNGVANASLSLGDAYRAAGDPLAAIEALARARQLFTARADEVGLAYVAVSMGDALTSVDRPDQAVALVRGAVSVFQSLRRRLWEARAWEVLGRALAAAGDAGAARDATERARRMFRTISRPADEAPTGSAGSRSAARRSRQTPARGRSGTGGPRRPSPRRRRHRH